MVNGSPGSYRPGNAAKLLLHRFAEVANDEGNFIYLAGERLGEIFHQPLNNGFSGYGNQGFGNRKGVRAQSGAPSCHGNNNFHVS